MDTTHKAQLLTLIEIWIEARPFVVASGADSGTLPPQIAATITTREPYHSRVMQDAHAFCHSPSQLA
jgi:hypothetical protein